MSYSKICLECKKQFLKNCRYSHKYWETAKFCSNKCKGIWYGKYHSGKNHWNYGKEQTPKMLKHLRHYAMKKGYTQEKCIAWKGDNISYAGIHKWLRANFEKPDRCENKNCCFRNPKKFEFALLRGKKYKRKRENFIMLCCSCHRKYDYYKNFYLSL